MKKLFLFLSAIPLLFLSACDDFSNLEMPESLSVKTAAKFAVPLGNGDIKIMEKANREELQEILDDNIDANGSVSSPAVYEYFPPDDSGKFDEGSTLQYIINYPIEEIRLKNQFKNSSGSEISMDSLKEIQLPEKTFLINDFIGKINESMKNILKIEEKDFYLYELGETKSLSDLKTIYPDLLSGIPFSVTSPDFATIAFKAGKIDITITSPASVSEDFTLNVELTLVDEKTKNKDNPITPSVSGSLTGPNKSVTLQIDLAGASIVPDMYLIIDGSIAGGTPSSSSHTYKFSMKASEAAGDELELSEITGLNMSNEALNEIGADEIAIDENFDVFGLDKSFVSATIEAGSILFFCKNPYDNDGSEKISGISCEGSYFTLGGGMTDGEGNNLVLEDKTTAEYIVRQELNLAGSAIKRNYDSNSDGTADTCRVSTAGSYIKPKLENARIVFPEDENDKIGLTLGGLCSIDKIGELKFDLGLLNSFQGTIDTGLKISTILSKHMPGDSENLIKDIEFKGVEGYVFMSQPTSNEHLKDIVIKGTVKATYESDGSNSSIYIVDDGSAGKAEMNMKGVGEITAVVDGSEQTVQSLLPELGGTSRIVKTDALFKDDTYYSHKVRDGAMDDLLNAHPDNLVIDYDMNLKTAEGIITLGQKDLDLLTGNASIAISLTIVVPLQFRLNDNYDVPESESQKDGSIIIKDVLSLAKTEEEQKDSYKDLLDRSEGEDSDFLKYADALKSAYISYNVTNELIKNLEEYYTDAGTVVHPKGEDLALKLTLYTVNEYGDAKQIFDENEDGACEKEIPVADGLQRLELSKNEVKKLLSKEGNPFIPKIRAEIIVPKNDSDVSQVQYIPRDGYFSVEGTVHLEFDENIPVEVWSK